MALIGCRIHCSGPSGLRATVAHMAERLGATYAIDLDYGCTHLVARKVDRKVQDAHRYAAWVHVVHPRWITRCYNELTRVPDAKYNLTFVLETERTGTRTDCGSVGTFFHELTLFRRVEAEGKFKRGGLGALLGCAAARTHPVWPTAVELLANTTFWGHIVRQLNWDARRTLIMAMTISGPRRGPYRGPYRGDSVLKALKEIPPRELLRSVLQYI